MYGDIERRELLAQNQLQIIFSEVGQSDIGAVKIRETVVFVLDVERTSHTARQLVNEAEDTVVAAQLRLRVRQLEAKRLPAVVLDVKLPQFAIGTLNLDL